MSENKYGIANATEIKLHDSQTDKESKDIRDREPIKKQFNPDTPILNLVKMSSPSYNLANHPLIRKYGYDTFGSMCDAWYWKESLYEASEEELWKIYALIQADWLSQYEYWYHKEVYKFRKYKREIESK